MHKHMQSSAHIRGTCMHRDMQIVMHMGEQGGGGGGKCFCLQGP